MALLLGGLELSCRVVSCGSRSGNAYDAAYAYMPEVICGGTRRPTAIVTVSDPGAWAALKWCSNNAVRVPEDLSILGFEDAYSSKHMIPSLSSIAHDQLLVVSTILDLLASNMSGRPRRILIPPVLVVRDSTGPAVSD